MTNTKLFGLQQHYQIKSAKFQVETQLESTQFQDLGTFWYPETFFLKLLDRVLLAGQQIDGRQSKRLECVWIWGKLSFESMEDACESLF